MIDNKSMWENLFGKLWGALTDSDNEIGGFLLNHADKTVMIDERTVRILGIVNQDYDTVLKTVEEFANESQVQRTVAIHKQDFEEGNITAGFVRIHEDKTENLSSTYPMLTQAALIQEMINNSSRSLLCLAKIEGVPQSRYREWHLKSALNAVTQALPANLFIAANTKNQFWIFVPGIESVSAENQIIERVCNSVKNCEVTDEFGNLLPSHNSMVLTIGIAGTEGEPTHRMHAANFAIYEAMANGTGSIRRYSSDSYEDQKKNYMDICRFMNLIEDNKFIYHFQPIVSVETGEVVAYEALMRTDESIGFKPLQILQFAEQTGKTYQIEYLTMFNVLKCISEKQEIFENRKIFINSITSNMLRAEDFNKLYDTYGELMEKVVLELTEQSETTDEELAEIHRRLKKAGMGLAIDDYGTGYSNTTNLLRYNPQIVKIDRSLITDIDTNMRTRKIVESIIGFLHTSGFIALAEGVETKEELQTMITLGADLIQGYYTARPRPVFLREISQSIKDEIIEFRAGLGEGAQKVYVPENCETIDLDNLVKAHYTEIIIDKENVILVGNEDQICAVPVNIKDGTDCKITLRKAGIESLNEYGAIRLGNNCNVKLICEGSNRIAGKGIFVPKSSNLEVLGSGTLDIAAEHLHGYGIGTGSDDAHGNIIINLDGEIKIKVDGDRCIGIGGGRSGENCDITIKAGKYNINCSGRHCIGIGTKAGNTKIDIQDAEINVKTSTPDAVGIGTFEGNLDLKLRNYRLNLDCSGHEIVGLGVKYKGTGRFDIACGHIITEFRGRHIINIGTVEGNMNYCICKNRIELDCEGDNVTGIGDALGDGEVKISQTSIDMRFICPEYKFIGTGKGTVEYDGGTRHYNINNVSLPVEGE